MIGCAYSCLYCYAKAQAIRFGRATAESWATERPGKIVKFGRREGTVMFPTSHDITAGNVEHCVKTLSGLLLAGNRVLVVSKPRPDIIERLVWGLEDNWSESHHPPLRERILFRFTIGSMDPGTLRFWEPNAPTFAERLYSLMWAHANNWQTSVSMEPMLDTDHEDAIRLARTVAPYVTDAVWIGKANKLGQRCSMNASGQMDQHTSDMIFALEESQRDLAIFRLHDQVMRDPQLAPKVKWKESIKKVVGIETPDEIGLDI